VDACIVVWNVVKIEKNRFFFIIHVILLNMKDI